MTKIALVGGRVIDPANQLDEQIQLGIAEGKVVACKPVLDDFNPDITIDATDLIVCPGLVDINANILSSKNDLATQFNNQLKTAVKAGITHVATHAFLTDRCLELPEIQYFSQSNNEAANNYFIGPLTHQLQGTRLSELMLMSKAGCIGFSNGCHPITNTLVKQRCYDYAAMLDAKIFISPEDPFLSQYGYMHEGEVNVRLGIPGIPSLAETLAITEELLLIDATKIQAHFNHISTARSVQILATALQNGISVSADVTIHQLYLTEVDVHLENGLCHVRPPLRNETDKNALREGIKNGVIKAISSDHTTLCALVKELPFQDSTPGIASWPVLLPLALRLVAETDIPLTTALSCLTDGPAKILGIDAGHLSLGSNANIVIFDPKEEWALEDQDLKLFGTNTPFKNWGLRGRVKYTLVNGEVVYSGK